MRYQIRHRTTYRYGRPVFESFNEIRLQPMDCPEQTLLDFDLEIEPPATVISFRDYYGNAVHDFGIPYLHDELVIEGTSDVLTHALEDQPLAGPPDGEDASPALIDVVSDSRVADELAEFLGPSQYIVLEDASAALARSLLADAGAESALAFLRRAAAAVRDRLSYRIGATTVESSVAEVLDVGSGVCQDYAHVLISICRHAGLPARYVSGCLGNVPEATASHAWVEAYVPPYGWVGIDATHGRACTGAYVKVGIGRDYADVTVLRGTYQGRGVAELEVRVTSETLDGTDGLRRLRGRADRRISPLVSIQNLGAVRQFRRGPLMTQTLGSMTQTLLGEDLPPLRRQHRADEEGPMQQPRQQQQGARPCG